MEGASLPISKRTGVTRRLLKNQPGKRRCVVILRERGGSSVPDVFHPEGQALSFIQSRIAPGTVVNADDTPTWNALHARFEMKRIDHVTVPEVCIGFNWQLINAI